MSESYTALYRGLWTRILGALGPGTDLYAAVLAIAPVAWDADLTEDTGTGTDGRGLQRIAGDFPSWRLWRPPSPDGAKRWWGARDGHTVIITSIAGELRAALMRHLDPDRGPLRAEVFFLDRRGW